MQQQLHFYFRLYSPMIDNPQFQSLFCFFFSLSLFFRSIKQLGNFDYACAWSLRTRTWVFRSFGCTRDSPFLIQPTRVLVFYALFLDCALSTLLVYCQAIELGDKRKINGTTLEWYVPWLLLWHAFVCVWQLYACIQVRCHHIPHDDRSNMDTAGSQ